MTTIQFAYWLMGVFEVRGVSPLAKEEVQIIKNHLDMVFAHEIDPQAGPKEHQEVLDAIHSRPPFSDDKKIRC